MLTSLLCLQTNTHQPLGPRAALGLPGPVVRSSGCGPLLMAVCSVPPTRCRRRATPRRRSPRCPPPGRGGERRSSPAVDAAGARHRPSQPRASPAAGATATAGAAGAVAVAGATAAGRQPRCPRISLSTKLLKSGPRHTKISFLDFSDRQVFCLGDRLRLSRNRASIQACTYSQKHIQLHTHSHIGTHTRHKMDFPRACA